MTDAIVAEAVGYTLYRYAGKAYLNGELICRSPGEEHPHPFDLWDEISAKDIRLDEKFAPEHSPPPFRSAPTWASDGIVGEYLCAAKAIPIRNDFLIALGNIIADRLEVSELGMLDWVLEREPGDIAQALLAVTKDG